MEFGCRYMQYTYIVFDVPSPRIFAHRGTFLIFLETTKSTIIFLHFDADNIGLCSLKFCLFLQE